MHQQEKPAFIMSQVTCALLRMEGMKVENQISTFRNEYPKYTIDDFNNLVYEFQIGYNDVLKFLSGE